MQKLCKKHDIMTYSTVIKDNDMFAPILEIASKLNIDISISNNHELNVMDRVHKVKAFVHAYRRLIKDKLGVIPL